MIALCVAFGKSFLIHTTREKYPSFIFALDFGC